MCLDAGDLEQASVVMKSAEQVVSIDSEVNDRYLELFTSLRGNEIKTDMRADVPEFLPKFHKETFDPTVYEFVPATTPNKFLEDNKENFNNMFLNNRFKSHLDNVKSNVPSNSNSTQIKHHFKNFSHGFKNK